MSCVCVFGVCCNAVNVRAFEETLSLSKWQHRQREVTQRKEELQQHIQSQKTIIQHFDSHLIDLQTVLQLSLLLSFTLFVSSFVCLFVCVLLDGEGITNSKSVGSL